MIRRLLKSPGFAVITLLTLTIGIGANTAIFSVINGIMLKPLPFHDSERLASLRMNAPGLKMSGLQMAPSFFYLLSEESKTLDHVGLWTGDRLAVNGLSEPEQVEGLDVTPSLLRALEVTPMAGRAFTDKDGEPGSPRTAMVTYAYLSRRFGGDPSNAIGKQIRLDSESHQIIGVLPKSFRFLDANPMLVIPLRFDRSKVFVGNFSFQGIARLKPGMTWAQVNEEGTRLLPTVIEKFPMPPGFGKKMFEEARFAADFRPLKGEVVGDIGTVLWVLMATIGIVLFIACANVANLLLVRADGRQQELAIRAALGATRMDLAKDLLGESIGLSLLGGLLGLGFAKGAIQMLAAIAPAGLPRIAEITMDPIVFAFAFVVALAAGALFGLVPVWKYSGPRTGTTLRDGGRTASAGRERHRARSALVVVQVALALVLLVGAGLMIRTFIALLRVDPGFKKPEQILSLSIGIPEAEVRSGDRVITIYQEMLRKISEIPGVESAAMGGGITMDGNNSNDPVFAEDHTYKDGELPPLRRYKSAGPGFLATLGNPLVAGRDFTWTDVQNRAPFVILSDSLARELWGDPGRAIGKRIRESPKAIWREVIGVAGNERDDGLSKPAAKTVHWPLAVKGLWGREDFVRRFVRIAIRSPRVGSEGFLNEVRTAIWSVQPTTPVAGVRTVKEILDRSMARTSFTLVMLGIAGAMALLLGVIGIFGVISYSVSQRTREIGIRTALGATSGNVRGMFVQHALVLAGIGIAIGLVASLALTRWMGSLLYEVSPNDAVTMAIVPVVLVMAALLASYLPARKATLIAPVEALRTQ